MLSFTKAGSSLWLFAPAEDDDQGQNVTGNEPPASATCNDKGQRGGERVRENHEERAGRHQRLVDRCMQQSSAAYMHDIEHAQAAALKYKSALKRSYCVSRQAAPVDTPTAQRAPVDSRISRGRAGEARSGHQDLKRSSASSFAGVEPPWACEDEG